MRCSRMTILGTTVLLMSGCAMVPSGFTTRIDNFIKDNGAGEYKVTTALSKDGKQLGSIVESWKCTSDAVQLTGCHQEGVTFQGPQ